MSFKSLVLAFGLVSGAAQVCASGLLEKPENVAIDIHPTDVIHWSADSATSFKDGTVVVGMRLSTDQDFSLYCSQVVFSSPLATFSSVQAPTPVKLQDPITQREVEVYRAGDFIVTFTGLEPFVGETFPVSVRFLGCTKQICLFPFTLTIDVKNFQANQFSTSRSEAVATPDLPASAASLEETLAGQLKNQGHLMPLWLFLILVFVGGMLTNLTPCVYPMIPITVRILARQGKSPVAAAVAYGCGIIMTYTLLGLLAAKTGSMFGQMMASTWLNVGFAALMAVLGVSMLGVGNFAKLQEIGTHFASKKVGVANSFLMGSGAGLVASPCTGPILAGLLTYIGKGHDTLRAVSLMFAYSLGFALPYVVLGSASASIAKFKVSPLVQTLVKVIFASTMFALAWYYLRIPLYTIVKASNIQFWGSVAFLGAILGFSAWYRLTQMHDDWQHKPRLLLIPTLAFGTCIFAATQWYALKASQKSHLRLEWMTNMQDAFEKAATSQKPLLVDLWAEWCEACKKMDASTFANDEVIKNLVQNKWILLRFDMTEETEESVRIQEKYQVTGLPTLLYFPAAGREPDKFEKVDGFVSAEAMISFIEGRGS